MSANENPDRTRRLRVGFLAPGDPADRQAWSGILFFMYEALRRAGLEVTDVGRPLRESSTLLKRALRRLQKGLGVQNRGAEDVLAASRAQGKKVGAFLRTSPIDVVFAAVASHSLAHLETQLPVVYMSDTTWKLVRSYYPENANISAAQGDMLEEVERRSIRRANRIVYPSTWAAASAVEDYGADRDRIRVIPYGANIDTAPPAEALPDRDPGRECRLLFIGNQWYRKGGDLALDTLVALREQGVKASLTLISGNVPTGLKLPDGAVPVGHIDKNDPEHRRRFETILKESHFLLLPTRADCSPIVCCEAAAYGLPVVATSTGGIPSLIENGVNGYLVPEGSAGTDYAKAIAEGVRNRDTYRQLAKTTRRRYEKELNWDAWAKSVRGVLEEAHTI